ncbi:hypothetical protein DVH05_028496 [Phytophthora capsici]|nr:hypothetical protein DVH05_028496 [Phytophthora capsici]
MRLTSILALALVATLHSSATAISSVKDSKAAIENGAVLGVDSALAVGARLLRGEYGNDGLIADDIVKKRANYGDDDLDDDGLDGDDDDLDDDGDDDDFDEERTLGDVVKKLNPVTALKKAIAKQPLKADEAYQKMIKRAEKLVYKN